MTCSRPRYPIRYLFSEIIDWIDLGRADIIPFICVIAVRNHDWHASAFDPEPIDTTGMMLTKIPDFVHFLTAADVQAPHQ